MTHSAQDINFLRHLQQPKWQRVALTWIKGVGWSLVFLMVVLGVILSLVHWSIAKRSVALTQEYEQKITSGKIYDLAEVVRDLNKGDDLMVDQSYSERQLFEKAYERLKSEFEAVLKISPEDVQKKMDKALGRNLNIESL